MPEYSATLTITTHRPLTEDDLFDIAALGGAATGTPGAKRVSTTLTINAPDPIAAAAAAKTEMAPIIEGDLTSLSIAPVEEQDQELTRRSFPELVGVSEIADRLGVSRQRASQLQVHRDFPEPVQVLRSGPVWKLEDLSRFEEGWERRGGRPRAATA